MQSKKLIFNSDDFGASKAFNLGVLKGHNSGVLTSTCILANGNAFDHAFDEILPQMPNIGLGIHLNIIEGKSLTSPSLICDVNGNFNKGFIYLLSQSKNKQFLTQIEKEFRSQIEKILSKTSVDHINSHVHTHAIPAIFELTAKLASEYGIKNIRTQFEQPYIVPNFKKHINTKYPLNLIKLTLLNNFTKINRTKLDKFNLNTNNYIIGVTYTGYMDENTVLYALKAIKTENTTTEILIHPTFYENQIILKDNYNEFLITQSQTIKSRINDLGWDLTNYKKIFEREAEIIKTT